jgi:hypothetical protein
MDRPSALARLNGKVLEAYSRRTIAELRKSLPLRLALPHIEPVIELNLGKEVIKDTLVIRRASADPARPPEPEAVRQLFMETRRIDDAFVARAAGFRVRLVVPYAEVEPLRMARITRLMAGTGRILTAWDAHKRLRTALRIAYTQIELEATLRQILDLYARETRALTRSVRLPALIEPLRERMAQHLLDLMAQAADRLARDVARGVYRERDTSAAFARPLS